MYMNAGNLIGFLGTEAEVKAAQDNHHELHRAQSWPQTRARRANKPMKWESVTEWHRILVFGKLGDFAATLTGDAHIEVEGGLRTGEQFRCASDVALLGKWEASRILLVVQS